MHTRVIDRRAGFQVGDKPRELVGVELVGPATAIEDERKIGKVGTRDELRACGVCGIADGDRALAITLHVQQRELGASHEG